MCVCLGAGAASEADFTTCTPRPLRRSHQVLVQREHVSGLAPSALVQIEADGGEVVQDGDGQTRNFERKLGGVGSRLGKGFSDQGSEANDDVKML